MTDRAERKPVRLELNNSGAWKLLARFDAGSGAYADAVIEAAAAMAAAINVRGSGRSALVSLRVSTDEPLPQVLLRWHDAERGWFAVGTSAEAGDETR